MPQAGYVYIVHGVGTNFIKIGQSTNLEQRLESLAQQVPFPLQLISVQLVYDSDEVEKVLLAKYAEYNTRGEWFALPEHLLNEWPVDAPVRSFFGPGGEKEKPWKPTRPHDEAVAWLQNHLQGGELPTTHIETAAAAVGITKKTLRRAREVLPIRVSKQGNAWYWRLMTPMRPFCVTEE